MAIQSNFVQLSTSMELLLFRVIHSLPKSSLTYCQIYEIQLATSKQILNNKNFHEVIDLLSQLEAKKLWYLVDLETIFLQTQHREICDYIMSRNPFSEYQKDLIFDALEKSELDQYKSQILQTY
jgi:hypothetical protein